MYRKSQIIYTNNIDFYFYKYFYPKINRKNKEKVNKYIQIILFFTRCFTTIN